MVSWCRTEADLKVLGLSNPNFKGVTIATKAVCTDHCAAPHLDPIAAKNVATQISGFKPDLLLVGGWSKGYDIVLSELGRAPRFPVLNVYHSTMFHGSFFGDDEYLSQVEECRRRGHVHYQAFVHPRQVEYNRTVRKQNTIWLPHFFAPAKNVPRGTLFRIGILGGGSSWYKNTGGAAQVAKDFAAANKGCEIFVTPSYDRGHAEFLKLLESCHVLIHISHLECYSNTIQEAWARGIPVIMSSACSGLYASPLVQQEMPWLKTHVLESNIDPMELRAKLEWMHRTWQAQSNLVHSLSKLLHARAKNYTHRVLNEIVRHKQFHRPLLSPVFDLPFTHPEELWL